MRDGTPSPYYRHDGALWSEPPTVDDEEETDARIAFRALMASRADNGYGFWRNVYDALVASEERIPPPLAPVRLAMDYPSGEVVYYIRFADRIKIGTTRNLHKRLQVVPYDEVLATEPGSYDVEADRHAHFAHLRITGEWFQDDPAIREHIAALSA